jgi:hypothetical protein
MDWRDCLCGWKHLHGEWTVVFAVLVDPRFRKSGSCSNEAEVRRKAEDRRVELWRCT